MTKIETRLKQPEKKYAGLPYREVMEAKYGHLPMWPELIRYDKNGDLILNGVHIPELITELKEAPIELVMPVMVERRANSWRNLAERVKIETKYQGGLGYLAASKASPEAATMVPALQAGWGLETSAGQDLSNLDILLREDLVSEDIRIVCNGPKLHDVIDSTGYHGRKRTRYDNRIDKPFVKADATYAELVIKAHKEGKNIITVLDSLSELNYLERNVKRSRKSPMKVGLRLKSYGLPKHNNEPEGLISRHGMSIDQMYEAAERVSKNPNLELDTFHAMVGAAEVMDIGTFVDSLMVCAEEYFEISKYYPELTRFNMGGGVPPMGFGWNHEGFLTTFFNRMQDMANEKGLPAPTIDFEFGSLLSAESSHHVIYTAEEKINHVDENGETVPWQYIEGSFMRMIPDTWIIGKDDWIILAANNTNNETRLVNLGGVTCDSDDVLPTILAPELDKGDPTQLYVILATGAYQKQLSGIGGVGHCTLKEAGAVIAYLDDDGEYRFLPLETKNREEAGDVLGYNEETLSIFK